MQLSSNETMDQYLQFKNIARQPSKTPANEGFQVFRVRGRNPTKNNRDLSNNEQQITDTDLFSLSAFGGLAGIATTYDSAIASAAHTGASRTL
jgi:hypothetical protein